MPNNAISSALNNEILVLHLKNAFHSVKSNRSFHEGEIITPFFGKESYNKPNRFSLQINDEMHILLSPDMLQFVNHSCNPNAFFNTEKMMLECIREINIGDEITFFYPSTEWDMAEDFDCQCGSENCLKKINGAKSLNKTLTDSYRLNSHILSKLAE